MHKNSIPQLKRKIFLYTIFSVLLSNCLVAVIAIFPLNSELHKRQNGWFQSELDSRVMAADRYLNRFQLITQQINSRTMIRDRLALYNAGKISLKELRDYTEPKLRDALDKVPEIVGLVRLDSKCEPVVQLGQPIAPEFMPSGFPADKKAWISAPHMVNGRPVINIGEKMLDNTGSVVGMDLVMFSLDGILDIVESPNGLGHSGDSALCAFEVSPDGKNHLLYASSSNLCNAVLDASLGQESHSSPMKWKNPSGSCLALFAKRIPNARLLIAMATNSQELYGPARRILSIVIGLIILASMLSLAGVYYLLQPLANRFLLRDEELRSIIDQKTSTLQQELEAKEILGKELQWAKEHAETASNFKSEFLASMSHEIRTPMNGILGMLQLLEETPLDEHQKEFTALAIQSSRRLTRLLSDILDLSRVEAGKMPMRDAPFNLHDSVDQVVKIFRQSAQEANLDLGFTIDPAIETEVIGDEARVQQVLTNLVGNALKFTTSGGIAVEVTSLPARDGMGRALFTVSDSGIGIPEDKLSMLCSPFTQVSTGYRRKFQGAGLGLSICKRLTRLMGGEFWLESEVGKGTSAFFHITYRRRWAGKQAADRVEPHSEPSLSNVRVLVAEDDRVNRIVASNLLEKAGCRATVVSDGVKALEALRTGEYDIVLMDVQMPVLDGIEATAAIRRGEAGEANRDIPIVALTAHAMIGEREKFLALGMSGYLEKPVAQKTLQQELRTQLKRVQAP
ncbi:hypothetical protein JCM15519_03000 [Fundidesulfovibrio butyratiphilus]